MRIWSHRIVGLALAVALGMDPQLAQAVTFQGRGAPVNGCTTQALAGVLVSERRRNLLPDAPLLGAVYSQSQEAPRAPESPTLEDFEHHLARVAAEEAPLFVSRLLANREDIPDAQKAAIVQQLIGETIAAHKDPEQVMLVRGVATMRLHLILQSAVAVIAASVVFLGIPFVSPGLRHFAQGVAELVLLVDVFFMALTVFVAHYHSKAAGIAAPGKTVLRHGQGSADDDAAMRLTLWHEWSHRLKHMGYIVDDSIGDTVAYLRWSELKIQRVGDAEGMSSMDSRSARRGSRLSEAIINGEYEDRALLSRALVRLDRVRWSDYEAGQYLSWVWYFVSHGFRKRAPLESYAHPIRWSTFLLRWLVFTLENLGEGADPVGASAAYVFVRARAAGLDVVRAYKAMEQTWMKEIDAAVAREARKAA